MDIQKIKEAILTKQDELINDVKTDWESYMDEQGLLPSERTTYDVEVATLQEERKYIGIAEIPYYDAGFIDGMNYILSLLENK